MCRGRPGQLNCKACRSSIVLPPPVRIDARTPRKKHEPAPGHSRSGPRPGRNPGMDRIAAGDHPVRRPRARALPARAHGRGNPPCRRPPAVPADHRIHQHDSAAHGGQVAGRSGDGMADPLAGALERDGHGHPRQPQAGRPRRAYRQLRLERDAVRRRLQPLLARPLGRPPWRPDSPPGPFQPRRLCALVPRRPHQYRTARPLPHGGAGQGQGPVVVSASVADARLLAGADRVDGPGPAAGDLPGPVHEVPRASWPDRAERPQDLVLHRRRRIRRARIARRDLAGRARRPRQPDLRGQLQPAAPRRPGARQRQDHPGTRRRVPRCRLERDQAVLGQLLGSAPRPRHHGHAAQADDGNRRRRVPELQGLRRRLHARAFLRQVSGNRPARRQPVRRRHLAPQPWRTRPAQGLCGLPSSRQHRRACRP